MASNSNNIKFSKNIEKCEAKTTWTPFLRQLLISSGAWTCYFSLGICKATPYVMIPQIINEANGTDVEYTASLIPTVHTYAGIPWIFIIPILLKYFGRKNVYTLISLTTFIGFVIFYLSNVPTTYFFSEIIHGLNSASQFTVAVILITEYTSPKHRGLFLTFKCATFFWGLWVANTIGTLFYWRTIGLFGIACSLYSLLVAMFLPESPYWLAEKGKIAECSKAYEWLHGRDDESETNLQSMIDFQNELQKTRKDTINEYIRHMYEIVTSPEFYKPILLSALLFCLYSFTSEVVFRVNDIEAVYQVTGKSLMNGGVLNFNGILVITMYMGAILSYFLRRRTLLLTSSSIGILFLLFTSLYSFLIKSSLISEDNYTLIALLIGFSVSVSCGPMILASTISGELISLESRNLCMCIMALTFKILNGIFVTISPYIFKLYGINGLFLIYGALSLILLIFIYKFLPETKDKTLEEIAKIMRGNDSTRCHEFKKMMSVKPESTI